MGQEETPGVAGELLRGATSLQGHGSLWKSCMGGTVVRTARMGASGVNRDLISKCWCRSCSQLSSARTAAMPIAVPDPHAHIHTFLQAREGKYFTDSTKQIPKIRLRIIH